MALKTLGRFEVLREIGNWNLGTVEKAIDPNNQRSVLIREIRRDDPHLEQKVHEAVQAAARATKLDSPNIVRILELGDAEGVFFLVSEYVEGVTLRSLLARKTEFSDWDLTDMTRQMGLAVDHAHSRGVVHTNLHPANVIQEWDGNIKLMDYGLLVNVMERIQGTCFADSLHYLSPEQVQGKHLDLRSNLFSWGAVLFELWTGQKAFPGEDAKAVLARIVNENPVFPEERISKRAGLAKAILKALAKAPADRYQSGAEFVRALEESDKAAPTMVTRPPVPVKAAEPAPTPNIAIGWTAPQPLVSSSASVTGPTPQNAPTAAISVQKPNGAEITVARVPVAPVPAAAAETPEVKAPESKAPGAQFIMVPSRAPVEMPVPLPAKPAGSTLLWGWKWLAAGAAAVVLVVGVALLGSVIHSMRQPISSTTPELAVTPKPVEVPAQTATPDPQPEPEPEPVAAPESKIVETVKRKPKTPPTRAVAPVITSELSVDSSPRGAQILLNGSSTGFVTPYTLTGLMAGQYTVTVNKHGYSPEIRSVQLRGGEKHAVLVELPESLAAVVVVTDPQGASVFVDGKDTGKLTPVTLGMRKGSHTIRVAKTGFFETGNNMEVLAGESYRFAPRLVPQGQAEEIRSTGKLKKLFGGGSSTPSTRVEIKTSPRGAQIAVNQRAMDRLTPAEFMFPVGVYEVILTAPGYKPIHKKINVVQGTKLVIDETMQKTHM